MEQIVFSIYFLSYCNMPKKYIDCDILVKVLIEVFVFLIPKCHRTDNELQEGWKRVYCLRFHLPKDNEAETEAWSLNVYLL